MSELLKDIQRWSASTPAWQQEAMVRLFQNGELTPVDDEDLYALLKSAHGITDLAERKARVFGAELVAPERAPGKRVQLKAISDLKRVNALATNKSLPIAPDGITAIYGDNGTGKSGYARVLKKACRSRDRDEPIHPNANEQPGPGQPASASFTLLIDGAEVTVPWVDGTPAHDALATFAIFDSRCARSYIDEDGDMAYSPYGMDILRGVAGACGRLQTKLEVEAAATVVNTTPFASLMGHPTAVGRTLSQLSAKTKESQITALATLSPLESDRLVSLRTAAAEPDPKDKAKQQRLRAGLLSGLVTRSRSVMAVVDAATVASLRQLIDASKSARQAADVAAKRFNGLLPGTGGEVWAELFQAARKFAAQVSGVETPPLLGEQATCPLCQQGIDEQARVRLKAFDAFIVEEAETTAQRRSAQARAAFTSLGISSLGVGLDPALATELEAIDPVVASAVAGMEDILTARRKSIHEAARERRTWDELLPMPDDPTPTLERWIKESTEQAAALDKLSDPKAAAQLRSELAELDDRAALNPLQQSVLDAIAALIKADQLKICARDVQTRAITEKAKELQQQVMSQALATALNKEFSVLRVSDLEVSFRTAGQRGKTVFGLVLEKPGEHAINRILSEGEQRAVAIASFLADLSLSSSSQGIVFDDPVSSLDHLRRWNVVARLVEEAKKRQVIIFTHDLYFLCLLQEESELKDVPCAIASLHRTGDGFGVADDSVPFDGAKTSMRVKVLRGALKEVIDLENAGQHQRASKLIRSTYVDLRKAWERGIEEVLLNSAVIRFRTGVETTRLASVEITDDDYKAINIGMTRCSYFPHDGAAIAQVPTPSRAELEQDINALEAWRSGIAKRLEGVKQRRGI